MAATSFYLPTGDAYIDGVLIGTKWASNTLTFSFPTDPAFYGADYGEGEPLNCFVAFTATQQAAVRSILKSYSSVANLTFTEITETASQHADLRYAESSLPGTAWAYYPSTNPEGGDAWYGDNTTQFNSPVKGNYAWDALIHETGHALGLKHPQDSVGSFGFMPLDRDSLEYSVMSYRSYVGGNTSGYSAASDSFPQTLMMYDIAALQTLYGANYSNNSGDTVYTWSPTTGQEFINGVGQGAPVGNKIFMTVWDGGGTDTYDFSNYTTNLSVNLQPGQWTTVSATQLANLGSGHFAAGNIANALLFNNNQASLIENAIGGSGNDSIIGNDASNQLTGGAGNDTVDGAAGADTLIGGTGNDTYVVDSTGDIVNETGGSGVDTVIASITFSLSDPIHAVGSVENLTLSGTGNIDGTGTAAANVIAGNSGDNVLSGGDGNDTIAGGAGNDTLDGGAGADSLAGGAGNDVYVVDDAGDTVDETGGSGVDTVIASITFSLSDAVHALGSVENLTLTGGENINGVGNGSANVITGNSGDNALSGGDGDDTLTGDTGNDTLAGGAGADRFIVDSGTDTVTDFGLGGADVLTVSAGATANVTVAAAWTAALSSSVAGAANLTTTGYSVDLSAATVVGTVGWNVSVADLGPSGSTSLTGSSGDDTLSGGSGDDTIDGGSGNDRLTGGAGADTLVYSTGGGADIITDFNASQGDRIDLTGVLGNVLSLDDVLALSSGTADTVIDFGPGDSLTLEGIAPGSLTAADFVFAVNLPATAVTLTNTLTAISESASTAIPIKVADIGFTDDGRGFNTFGLSGADAAAFEIVGTELFLKAGTVLDFEGQSSYVVAVTIDDPTVGATPDAVTATYTLNITNAPGVSIAGTSDADSIGAISTPPGQPFPTGEEDIIQALGGDDVLQGLGGNDSLDGGDGRDTAVYTDATGGIAVDLASGTVTGAGVGTDTLRGIEQIRGGDFADTLVAAGFGPGSTNAASAVAPGAFADAVFEGMGGDDTISGNGTTLISYQSATGGVTVTFASEGAGTASGDISVGNDVFSGVDSVRGSGFDDTLLGSSGDEQFIGGGGNDTIDGGGGFDRVSYVSPFDDDVTAGVTIDLAAGTASGNASVGADTLRSIEAIRGSDFDDLFDATGFGQAGALNIGDFSSLNEFEGMAGDDHITGNGNTRIVFGHATAGVTVDLAAGMAGGDASVGSDSFTGVNAVIGSSFADTITGDSASNTLTGGLGADTFGYAGGGGADTITDFNRAEGDKIDLTGVDNVFSLGDLQALASGTTDTVIDFGAGHSLTLTGIAPESLTGADFIFATNLAATAVTLTSMVVAIAENTSTAAAIKVADIGFSDDGHGSNTFGLSGADAAAFQIVGTELFLKSGTVLDRESQSSYAVTVTVDDPTVGGTPDASAIYTLNVANVPGVTVNGTSSADVVDATHTAGGQPLPTNEEDIINGNGGNDSLQGLGGDDTLNGGTGNDTMLGGLGNDTYVVDATLDVVTENPAEGTDTIQTGLTYTLGANIENLALTGTAAISGTGNGLGNAITGNGGNNILAGLGGADSLDGGLGLDTASYAASTAAVNVSLTTGAGTGGDAEGDTLINIENLTGSALNDTLEGDGGNNVLSGGSGTDTLSYQHAAAGVTVSLALTAAQSTIGAGTDTLSSIENLIGSGFDDTLTGSSAANVLTGGAGNDTLNGSSGNDTMLGGQGNDSYVVDTSYDVVTENAGEGDDTVMASATYTIAANIESLTLTGAAAINGTGNALGNAITGNIGNNILAGLGGADSLDGGMGLDTASYAASTAAVNVSLWTGTGTGGDAEGDTLSNIENITGSALNDTLEGDSGNNVLNGGSGTDTLSYQHAAAGVTVSLALTAAQNTIGAGLDTLTYFENLIGSGFDDTLTGSSAANVLTGGGGNDTLNGSTGNDTMLGGQGNDTYVVDSSSDVVIENDGEGTDAVQSSVSYTLASNVENLTLTGTAAINGTGNALGNAIVGNGGNNILAGLGGADSLDGGLGLDTASYAASTAAVNVSLTTGAGTGGDAEGDTLINIENLTGSALNDTLEGDGGNNVLSGGSGTDTLSYQHAAAGVTVSLALTAAQSTIGAGTDTLSSIENLIGSGFDDTLTGSSAANVLTGGAGNDTLNGSTGSDTMLGGQGNDSYVVDSSSDVVIENNGEGNDTVTASVTYTIAANIENLTLTGAAAINGTGNALGNAITGNTGNNTLAGLGGADSLDGGAGLDTASYASSATAVSISLMAGMIGAGGDAQGDTLINIENLTGSAGNDTLEGDAGNNVLSGGSGTDTVTYEHSGLAVTVSLALTAAQSTVGSGTDTLSSIENLTGSAFNDTLTGSSGANVLSGGAGNDTLTGGSGNDTLSGGSGSNTFVFGSGFGVDRITDFKVGQDIVQIDHSVLPLSTNLAAAISDCGCGFARLTASGNTITFVGVSPTDMKQHLSDIHIV